MNSQQSEILVSFPDPKIGYKAFAKAMNDITIKTVLRQVDL